MPSLTIKNIPDELFDRLKSEAAREHRSLNKQVISCLEKTLYPPPVDVLKRLEQARQIRAGSAHVVLKAADIRKAREHGRR